MLVYKRLIRPLLFRFNPEQIHKIVVQILKLKLVCFIFNKFVNNKIDHKTFNKNGFSVKNIIGLAAGLDKDAEIINGLTSLGFGFIEIGTVTPKAQPGNNKPRLSRLIKDEALLNRMGFNNKGINEIKKNIIKAKAKTDSSIGINLGKNKSTPIEQAYMDYVISFNELYKYGDYFVINVSSPNTPNLRQLQDKDNLEKILLEITNVLKTKTEAKPLFLKIAPDLTFSQIDEIINLVIEYKLTGIIAVNTTVSRDQLSDESIKKALTFGDGGLSGKPLKNKSTEIIKYIKSKSNDKFLIIGVGGISSCEDVREKLNAGADLIQIYTSFIYEGPRVVKKLNSCL